MIAESSGLNTKGRNYFLASPISDMLGICQIWPESHLEVDEAQTEQIVICQV